MPHPADGDAGMGLYTIDAALMERLAPDVIVTQSLCEVGGWERGCAGGGGGEKMGGKGEASP